MAKRDVLLADLRRGDLEEALLAEKELGEYLGKQTREELEEAQKMGALERDLGDISLVETLKRDRKETMVMA